MKYKISELHMSQNFQGLYIGTPRPEDKERAKTEILSKLEYLHPDMTAYEDWTEDFPYKNLDDDPQFKNVVTYGNIVFAVIEFKDDPDKERNADWALVNIMFNYYPSLGEKLEEAIDKKLKEKTYNTQSCYY